MDQNAAINEVILEYDVIEEPEQQNEATNLQETQNDCPPVPEGATGTTYVDVHRPSTLSSGSQDDHNTIIEPDSECHRKEKQFNLPKDGEFTNDINRDTKAVERSRSQEKRVVELAYPRVNCKEKIVICIDLSQEMGAPTFKSRAGDKFSPLRLLKKSLGIFLNSKSRINKTHEYALVILQDTATWVCDFTSDTKQILHLLEDLEAGFLCETCDLASLFKTIEQNVVLPHVDGDMTVLPPPYIVRILLLYGRSHCDITSSDNESQRALYACPYVFLDALYVHEVPSEENSCVEIFESLCGLDEKGLSYIYEVSRNPTRLYDCVASLLAHPLQRPLQRDVGYKINPRTPDE